MIRSMTGYGDAAAHEDGVHYHLELRSLNNRYLKVVLRLPEDLQSLEAELESAVRARFARGAVTLLVRVTDESVDAAQRINHAALRAYIEQLRVATSDAGVPIHIDAGTLLGLPGVVQPPPDEDERAERRKTSLLRLLDEATGRLIEMRRREGEALRKDLRGHLDEVQTRLNRVGAASPNMTREYEERLRARILQLAAAASIEVEPADLVREIAIHAERTDIAEEIARLNGHLEQFSELIDAKDDRPVGRTLDFVAQEMLREANTIASKCSDVEISREIVEVKGSIDRIKEQIQNVE